MLIIPQSEQSEVLIMNLEMPIIDYTQFIILDGVPLVVAGDNNPNNGAGAEA